jgi:pimeloyl-ACP methyl ester carboxylesterase
MLREDPLGGHIDNFEFLGKKFEYHIEGEGETVLITHGMSGGSDSYDWRYIFDCLAGRFLVYALDLTGTSERPVHGRSYYADFVEAFIRQIVRKRTSIIASPVEAPYVLLTAFQAPRLVDKVMLAYPDGTVIARAKGSIARDAVERKLGIPSIEEITGGRPWRPKGCGASLRRFATGRIASMSGCNALFRRAGASPGGIDPLRFCDDAIRFLG